MAKRSALLTLALLGPAPLAAQVRQEWTALAVGVTGRPASAVAGVGWARRPGHRDRVQLFLGGGVSEERPVARGEALWHFLLEPARLSGAGVFVGGGLAGEVGRTSRARLVITLGIEASPAGRRGWAVEAGLGGGVRVAVGYRVRK